LVPISMCAIQLDGQDGTCADIGTPPPKPGVTHEFKTDVEIRVLHDNSGKTGSCRSL
jgi:hypothetical protein